MRVGNGWNIEVDHKPIPIRKFDYNFWHDDNCDTEILCGNGETHDECLKQIRIMESEHPYFNEDK